MKLIAYVVLLFTTFVNCERISNFNQVGQAFVQQYYALFDNNFQRAGIRSFYDTSDSALVYASALYFGSDSIMNRLSSVSNVVQRNISSVDSQPTNDAGVIVNVFGRIIYSDTVSNYAPSFDEMFILKPKLNSWYIQNQYVRTSLILMNSIDGLRFV